MYHRPVAGKRSHIVFIIIILYVLIVNCEEHRPRVKRKVVFSKNTKLFWRLNIKANVIPWVRIFGQGVAVRINWDLPDTLHRRYKFFKRDLHDEIEHIPSFLGMRGYSCIFDYICNQAKAISNSPQCGVFCEIGNIINLSSGVESDFFKSLMLKCDYYRQECMGLSSLLHSNETLTK